MEKQLIPQLRFSEFEGEWEKEMLINLSHKVAYGMNASATAFDGVNRYLRITDIDEDSRKFMPKPLSSSDDKIEDKFILKKGDIVFARTGASVGKSYLYNEADGKLLYAGFLIKFNIINAVPYFVFLQTFRESYRKWVQVYSMRSGQPGLNAEEYKLLKFNIPKVKEQQKIAAFLSDVDKVITEFKKKKSLIEQYKKSIIQKIFNQELRFKDDEGNAFPEWEEKKLKEFISEFIVPMRDKPKDLKGEIPWCRIEDFNGKYLYKSKSGQGVSVETVKKMNLKVYPINTLLVSCSANLGFCAIVKKELVTNQTFIGLYPNLNKVDVSFLYHIMKLSSRRLNVLSSGTTISYLSRKQFENFTIQFPCIKEQIKIANFLSDIDTKIEVLNTKIENSKTFKKGLLQKMFV
jgi:type I restriction enzyme S subunit